MTAATAPTPDVAEYLAAVRDALVDLPPAERDDLIAEVEASLFDAAAEGGSITARLGPPEEFAAELRAAAGLQASAPADRRPEPELAARVRDAAARLRLDPRFAAVARVARELAPIWWVVRGYVVVAFYASVTGADWSTTLKLVPIFGTAMHALLAIAVAVVISVVIGLVSRLRGTPWPRLAVAANVAIALAAVPVASELADFSAQRALVAQAYAPPAAVAPSDGVWNNGNRVDNIYPFSRDGKLLHDVLLYDGAGQPLDIASTRVDDPNRRFVVTNGDRLLFNVFPIRYYEPGTRRVARPNAKPYIELPLVLTPPLRQERAARR